MPDRFELKDLNAGVVTLFVVGVPLFVGAALLISAYLPGAGSTPDAGLPSPQAAGSWGRELRDLHDAESKSINTYGWVDRERGMVRVPVDRAIDLFLAGQEKP